MLRQTITFLLVFTVSTSSAFAHYLWVIAVGTTAGNGTANIYFEGGPAPGDGHYLDPILKSNKTWVRTVEQPAGKLTTAKDIKKEKLRWLQADLSEAAPRSIDTYAKFGVYSYGKTEVLLHYYARTLDLKTHEDLHELARAEQMALDIVPHDFGKQMTLRVLWQGKPVPDRTVHIRGPKGFKQNLTTDADGNVKFHVEGEGRFTFRTNIELDEQGKDGDRDYVLVRHHATMIMNLPLEK